MNNRYRPRSTSYSYSYSYKKKPTPSFFNLKETFFVQITACGILTLGILVFVMLSPTSTNLRSGITYTLADNNFFGPHIPLLNTATLQNPQPQEAPLQGHQPQDFSIDESLLDDVNWRRDTTLEN